METGDHAAIAPLRAPDGVLHSPLVRAHFEGRRAVADLVAAVIDTFEGLHWTVEADGGDVHAFAFSARVRGREIDGVDLIRVDANGLIREMKVHIRPLAGLGAVAAALAPRLGRGRLSTLILRVLAAPLPHVLGLVDPTVRRLARLR